MKKRYSFKQKIAVYIMFAIVTIIALTCITVNSLRLAQVGNLTSTNRGLDIFAICIMSFVELCMISVTFASCYVLGDKKLYCFLGVTLTSILYKDVCLVRYSKEKRIFLVYFKVDKNGILKDEMSGIQARFVRINVNDKYFDEIAKTIKKHASQAVIEILGEEEK